MAWSRKPSNTSSISTDPKTGKVPDADDTGLEGLPPNHQRAPKGFIGWMAGSKSAASTTGKSSSE
jgi:hypothetical protein